ncbi:MAG: TonB-dependent receptor, partial [Burkholderiales bacterium]
PVMFPFPLPVRARPLAIAMAMLAPVAAPRAQSAPEAPVLPEVTVTGTREAEPLARTPSAVGVIPADTIRRTAPAHPSQLLGQVPGVAAAVTNGEGHTTAIRQPFTTAPVYLFLEDGIPIRPTGFFNHNALYETNLPQAGGVEVVRGPGSALYGSDAIGGIVNVLTRAPTTRAGADARLEAGSFGWRRLLAGGDSGSTAWGALRGDLNLTHTDGWRDATAYDRRSGSLRWDAGLGDATVAKTVLAFSRIDQQTGANSPLPRADYLNRPTLNYRPIAFRTVDALRLSTSIDHELGDGRLLTVTPYVRDNAMDLLASFNLPSDPTLARTSSRSFGVAAKWRQDWAGPWAPRLVAGVDLETSPGARREDRVLATTSGSGASRLYSSYTLGARVFDYDVTFTQVSPYLHGEVSPVERLRVTAGLRFDRLAYRFDNRIDAPAVRDAASGAWYGQVADTSVSYSHLSPKLGATWAFDEKRSGWIGWSNGFRAPSEAQLFRPSVATSAAAATQQAALSARLRPIEADQIEVGLRGREGTLAWELVGYRLDKRDDLVSQRDLVTNVTTTVNAGHTRHQGVEAGLGWVIAPGWRVDGAVSYAVHRYVDWVTATADFSGKEMEAAPRLLASLRLGWQPVQRGLVEVEWTKVGPYWLEASNSAAFGRYDGHGLWNLRAAWPIAPRVALFGRVTNLTDVRWADSASVSSNTAVYSPGLPRSVFVGVDVRW